MGALKCLNVNSEFEQVNNIDKTVFSPKEEILKRVAFLSTPPSPRPVQYSISELGQL